MSKSLTSARSTSPSPSMSYGAVKISCLAPLVIVYFVHVGFLNQTRPAFPDDSATTSSKPSRSNVDDCQRVTGRKICNRVLGERGKGAAPLSAGRARAAHARGTRAAARARARAPTAVARARAARARPPEPAPIEPATEPEIAEPATPTLDDEPARAGHPRRRVHRPQVRRCFARTRKRRRRTEQRNGCEQCPALAHRLLMLHPAGAQKAAISASRMRKLLLKTETYTWGEKYLTRGWKRRAPILTGAHGSPNLCFAFGPRMQCVSARQLQRSDGGSGTPAAGNTGVAGCSAGAPGGSRRACRWCARGRRRQQRDRRRWQCWHGHWWGWRRNGRGRRERRREPRR